NQQGPEFFGHGLLPGPRARERNATITPQNRICPAELRIAITKRLRWITPAARSARLRQSRPTGGTGDERHDDVEPARRRARTANEQRARLHRHQVAALQPGGSRYEPGA